jgi:hypothetical protein
MKFLSYLFIIITLFSSCKSKRKKSDPNAEFFPVAAYLKGQVAQMDTSLATIIKIEKIGNNAPDTSYIKREEFKKYAKEFIELPDISSKDLKEDYEVTNMYDDLLDAFIFTYTTTEEDHEIKKEDVILEPSADGNNKVKTVNIDKWVTKGDSTVHKILLWEADKRFLIITKMDKANQPEKIHTLEVKWNNFPAN